MASFRIIPLDLSSSRTSSPLDLGAPYREFLLLDVPSGAELEVELEQGGQGIPLAREGDRISLPEVTQVIYLTHEAVTGTALILATADLCVELGGGGGGELKGLYEAVPTTVSDGEFKHLLIDDAGRLYVRLADSLTESEDTVGVAAELPGTEGNLWAAATPGAGGDSSIVDISGGGVVSIFGNVDGATDLDVYYSQDGATFYQSGHQISLAGAGDFGEDFRIGAAHIRLRSSAAVTVTATAAVKP